VSKRDPYLGPKLSVISMSIMTVVMGFGFFGAQTEQGKLVYGLFGGICFLLMCIGVIALLRHRKHP